MGYELFEQLCREKGVTVYRISKLTGIPTSAFSNWKAGRYQPKIEKRRLIADALGVSVDVLDGNADTVHKSVEGNEYYFSDETAKLAQELLENKGRRVLFDATEGLSEDDLRKFASMIEAYKSAEGQST